MSKLNSDYSIVVSKGFFKKTGYYFRVKRAYQIIEESGRNPVILCYKSFQPEEFSNDANLAIRYLAFANFYTTMRRSRTLCFENIGIGVIGVLVHLFSSKQNKRSFILDYHGGLDDLSAFKYYKVKRFIYSIAEKYILNKFDKVIVVSNQFKVQLCEKYKNNVADIITVIPNFPDDKFIKNIEKSYTRECMQISEQTKIFTYVGNAQKWQNLEYISKFIYEIQNNESNVLFLFLTGQMSEIEKTLIDNGVDMSKCVIKTVPNYEVPKYLKISNYLLMLRQVDMINKVACPTKAVEYMFSKTPIIISKGLGDISDIVVNSNSGFIVDYDDTIENNVMKLLSIESYDVIDNLCLAKYSPSYFVNEYKSH